MDIPMNDLGEEPATDQTRLLDQPETLPEPATPAHSEASSSGSEPGVQRELDSGPEPWVPEDEERARQAKFPPLNWRPLVLSDGFLVFAMAWFLLTSAGTTTLVILGQVKPPWFHFRTATAYDAWVYLPGIIAFFTSIWWRWIRTAYDDIIPYVEMTNVPTTTKKERRRTTLGIPLPAPGDHFDPYVMWWLIRGKNWLTVFVYGVSIPNIALTPIKSNLLQTVRDPNGWSIVVSFGMGITAAAICLGLFLVTLAIFVLLRNHRTGLKWSPASLAAKLSLVQSSNILPTLSDLKVVRLRGLDNTIREWHGNYGVPRLGYWKLRGTNKLIYGVRFEKGPKGASMPGMQGANLEDVSRQQQEQIVSVPSRIDGPSSTIRKKSTFELRVRHETSPQARHQSRTPGGPAGAKSWIQTWKTKVFKKTTKPAEQPEGPQANFAEDRVWNIFLRDWWIGPVFAIGLIVWIITTIFLALGNVYQPLRILANPQNLTAQFGRGLLFSFLPTILFALFNGTFVFSDHYHRIMIPIQNMVKDSAAAEKSVLMDYVSTNIFWVIFDAMWNGHIKIWWGATVALICTSSHIVAARVFTLSMTEQNDYVMLVAKRNFIAAYAILTLYLVIIWFARPYGVVRTCRPLYTLVDFGMMCHRSYILKCPEFCAQDKDNTEEHLRSQVILANRKYQFGIYHGMDGQDHLGISLVNGPESWEDGPEEYVDSLLDSISSMRYCLSFGLYDRNTRDLVMGIIQEKPQTKTRVNRNELPPWRQKFNDTLGKIRRAQTERGDKYSGSHVIEIQASAGKSSSVQHPARSLCSPLS